MNEHERACALGRLMVNFHSLEFALRAFLQGLPGAPGFGLPHGIDVYSFPVGTELPLNEFTNYDSLGTLIRKYNDEMRSRRHSTLDATLIDLRDALAHGRIAARWDDPHTRLLKFSKPEGENVRITFNEEMTSEWLSAQVKRVNDALQLVLHELEPQQGVPADRPRPAGSAGG
jgi:hypothetical protein